MTDAVMDAIPESVREALEATSRRYGLYCRRSREAAEEALEIGRVLFWIKEQLAHGLWMPALRAMKISYDAATRHMRAVKWGATVEMLMEHGLTGTLDLLSQQRRAAKAESDADPEPGPDPAAEEDAKFCSSAKFDPPLEMPPGAGDAPSSEDDEEGFDSASGERAAEAEAEGGEDGPEDAPVWPWPLDDLDMKFSGDRMILCLLSEDMKTLQERAIMAVIAYCNGFDKTGKQVPCTVMPLRRLAAIARKDVRTVQGWLQKARSAGWLHSDPRGPDKTDAQYVWPHTPAGMRQGSLPLMRTFDRAHRASAAEAAESAAARPRGETPFTPGVKPASPRGESPVAREVRQGSPLTGKGTGKETEGRGMRSQVVETPEPASPHPPDAIQAFGIWNAIAAETGMRPAVELDADRAAKLKARVRDAGGMDEFRAVCERAGRSKALTGRKPGSWPADLDQFLEPRFFRRVREGGWDDAPSELERSFEALRDTVPDPEELRAEVLMSPLAGDAPAFVEGLCDRIGVGWVRSWLKDCRLERRGDGDAALLFTNGFSEGRVDRDYGDAIRNLWRELHGGELVLETRRAA
ncbi:MAG: hypothetical protein OXN81_11255 [Alphaproteobacteria bacterium]|nr:hypothetical protein [Alphaproteobacteria bacterium]